MAALIIPSRRVWQPQGAAQIDRNSQIGRGLREALVPSGSHLFYAELGRPLRFAGAIQPVVISGQFGTGVQNTALTGSQEYIGAVSIASDATLAVVGRVPSIASNSTVAALGQAAGGSQLRISIGDGTTAGVVRAEAYIGGGNRVFGGSFTLPVGSDYIAIARHKNGVLQDLWVNGIQDPATLSQAGNFIGLGYFGRQGALTGTPIFLAATWQRALSDQEIRDFSLNPWQIFRPVQRRVYFDMGAGGGGEPATHDTSGAITSLPAELSGAAERTRQHDTSAELAGAGSVVSATARRNVTLGSSGALSVGLAVVTASASHTAGHAEHSTSGTVAAPGASLSGSASRVPAPATHDTSGDLGGMGAVIDGQAQGPQTGSMRPGFEMSSRKVYIKRGKRIHIFDSVEDADAWMEAEQQEIQAIRRAKPTPRKKAKVFKALDEAIPHEVVRLDVVRAMVDYLGIPVEMPTLEARQDWAEVARVALMARQMQDEEDIELLLAA